MQAKRVTLTILALAVLYAIPANADTSASLTMCVGCHGEDGIGTGADIPIIAGIPAVIQEDALYAYIDGDRDCGNMPLMCNIVARLSEEDVQALANYFAALPFRPAGEDFDAALAEKGEAVHVRDCAICHSEGASASESSILHGQRKNYLRYTLEQYAAGERTQLPAMQRKTSTLTGDDIEALLNYYASIPSVSTGVAPAAN